MLLFRLFVVAHGEAFTEQSFTAGVPRGGDWFPLLINLYICHLNFYIAICFEYTDDSYLVKLIERKEDRLLSWGGVWNLNIEPAKYHSLCFIEE